jgi:hypothetical protein
MSIEMIENMKGNLTKADDVPETKPQKKTYEKPVIIESPGMTFPKEIWEKFIVEDWCFACTNCNCN